MNVFTFITVVVVASLAAGLVKAWMQHRHATPKADPKLDQELAELKARVAALERIVTDSEFQLKKDFEKL
ncbi:hypothetical protein [Gallaecimonas xiamenensis]|uniref:Phage shock protein B n=1 Tax=Gallaecimonas xiamenensis 3-C-1 TaxID=745411 RepID=K2K397_9GAMM|nr:hypothetical protein [Gallaecimonas xiamenensis]EKE77399.1 hypothetical protein B3C1_01270 [Gallaecimonas xiamenensis 3-C-1]